jgi:hypothetical protein
VQEDLVTGRGVDLINLALDTHGSDPVLCESGLTALASTTDDLDVRDLMMRVRVMRVCVSNAAHHWCPVTLTLY